MRDISRKIILTLLFLCAAFPVFSDDKKDLDREMMRAVRREDASAVRSLLESGADPNGSYDGSFFLERALGRSDYNAEIAQLLLDHGADIRARNSRGQDAAFYGHSSGLELITSLGIRFDTMDDDKRSPLLYRLRSGYFNEQDINFILDWEKEHAPSFCADYENRNDYLTEALTLLLKGSVSRGIVPLTERLLAEGANHLARDEKDTPIYFFIGSSSSKTLLPIFFERGIPLDEVNKRDYDRTLLMYAARDDCDMVETLLRKGADPNQQDSLGKTALFYARCEHATTWLLAKGADPNFQDKKGKTALLDNWTNPNLQLILLRHGADPSIADNEGTTPLHYYGWKPYRQLLDEFVGKGADINAQDKYGDTPLIKTAQIAYEYLGKVNEAITALLQNGADPSIQNKYGKTAFYYFIESTIKDYKKDNYYKMDDPVPIAKALLDAGANPGELDNEGESALSVLMGSIPSSLIPLRTLAKKYADTDDVKTARAHATQVRNDKAKEFFKNDFPAYVLMFTPSLLYSGLAIGMREGVFKDNPTGNFFGPINSTVTFTAAGFAAGLLLFLPSVSGGGSEWSNMFDGLVVVAGGLLGAGVGFIAGIILSAIPEVRNTFNTNPLLYYLPTALVSITLPLLILNF